MPYGLFVLHTQPKLSQFYLYTVFHQKTGVAYWILDRNCRILPFFIIWFTSSYYISAGWPEAISFSSPHSQRTQYNSFKLSLLCNTGLRRCLQSFGVYTNKEIADYATVTHWPQNLRGLTITKYTSFSFFLSKTGKPTMCSMKPLRVWEALIADDAAVSKRTLWKGRQNV